MSGRGQRAKSSVSQTLPLPSRTTSIPMRVNDELSRLRRCPSDGGFSLNMAWLRPLAEFAIAAVVLAAPPTPQFSPAADHFTPSAWIRSPRSASPGHRCDRPHPAAMARLCLCALVTRPDDILYGGRPAAVRQVLVWSRTACATGESADRAAVSFETALRVLVGVGGCAGGAGAAGVVGPGPADADADA